MIQKMKHHLLQTYWPVALSTVYETLVPPIMWFTYQLSGVGSICSYKWDLSVFSPSIYATLWNSCSVPHTSGLRKFPVQPCNWRVVPFKHFGYLKRHFFYLISMLCHVLANITGNRTIINIFSNLTKGAFCRDYTNCPATLFCDQTRHTPSGFLWGFRNACINNKITKKKVKIYLSKRSVSTIWAFLKKSHASVNIASIYPFGHLNVLLII